MLSLGERVGPCPTGSRTEALVGSPPRMRSGMPMGSLVSIR